MIFSKQMVTATARPLILAILKRGENYGYQIIKKIMEISEEEISWSEPMLYPFLQRMEKEGLIKSKWKMVDNRRFRRYYRLTERGLAALESERIQWLKIHAAFQRLLEESR